MSFRLFHRCAIDRWLLVPLRLIVGFGFMEHGFSKLAKGPEAFANILQALGVPAPYFMAWFTILVEVLGGLAVILGAFATLASLSMAAVSFGCYVHRASALRIQLDQAQCGNSRRRAVRSAWL